MSIKLQILLNFWENVSWKSTGNRTCWSVRHPVLCRTVVTAPNPTQLSWQASWVSTARVVTQLVSWVELGEVGWSQSTLSSTQLDRNVASFLSVVKFWTTFQLTVNCRLFSPLDLSWVLSWVMLSCVALHWVRLGAYEWPQCELWGLRNQPVIQYTWPYISTAD